MSRQTPRCTGNQLRRSIAACALVATVLSAAACAPVNNDGANDGEKQKPPEITFAGRLVIVDGQTVADVDGGSGARRDVSVLDGELGWSGFTALRDDGALVYESIVDGVSSIRLSDGSDDTVLASEVTAVHGHSDTMVIVSHPGSTHAVPFDGGGAIDLRLEEVAAAAISPRGSEIAFSSAIPTATAESLTGELEQRLAVRTLAESGPGEEVDRGWYTFRIHWLDDEALAYTRYPFGGADLGDVVLVDRRSNETTLLASAARIIDADGARRLLAIAHGDNSDAGMVSIVDCSDPSAAIITDFESPPADSIDSASLVTRDLALVVAFRHEDSTSTLVKFDASAGTQRTLSEFGGVLVPEIRAHPSASIVLFVTERQGAAPGEVHRTVNVYDLDRDRIAELAEGSVEGLLTLVGVIE